MKVFYIDTSSSYLYAGISNNDILLSSIKKNYGQDCSQENKKNYIGKCVGYYQTFLTNVLYNHQNNIEKYFKIFVNKLSDKKILYDEFTNDLDKMFTHGKYK